MEKGRPKLSDDELKHKRLTIRLDADTYAAWQGKARAAGTPLAVWARDRVAESLHIGRPPVLPVDPRLVRQLQAIGNNLNQLARAANRQQLKWRLDLLEYLINVERALLALKEMPRHRRRKNAD